jgi:hypothetical protein
MTTSKKRSNPTNMSLYNKVKKIAKQKFDVWPSAYASGWMVKEYKKRGGGYSGKKTPKNTGLNRWFDEKWINVCKLPKKVSCGRPSTSISKWKKTYPYCRPSKRITNSTPSLSSGLTKKEIKRRCSTKKKSPSKRVFGSPKRKSPKRKSPKRKSPKRKSPKRKSPKRKSPKSKVKSRRKSKVKSRRKSKVKSRRKSKSKSKVKSPKSKVKSRRKSKVKSKSKSKVKSRRKSRRKSKVKSRRKSKRKSKSKSKVKSKSKSKRK